MIWWAFKSWMLWAMWWANGASPASTPPRLIYPACGIFPFCARKADMWLSIATLSAAAIKTKCCILCCRLIRAMNCLKSPAPALADTAEGRGQLDERPRVRLFARTDDFKRYVSAIVYLPREQFNAELRQRVRRRLAEAFAATESDFPVQLFGESPLARLRLCFAPTPLPCPTSTPPRWSKTSTPWCAAGAAIGSGAAQQGLSAEQTGPYRQAFSAGYQ